MEPGSGIPADCFRATFPPPRLRESSFVGAAFHCFMTGLAFLMLKNQELRSAFFRQAAWQKLKSLNFLKRAGQLTLELPTLDV
ncbi:hypothetical protein FIV00_22300 [Labrenzia sp. THAF82]|nr:hypothetical protein FIV00_22300 [Labrenzia sp. THAF82]